MSSKPAWRRPWRWTIAGNRCPWARRLNAKAGLSGWAVWSLGEVVVRRGMGDVPRALRCLHALTQRFSAEFAIRPFIARHPQTTLATLALVGS
jgi:hypothetical protein